MLNKRIYFLLFTFIIALCFATGCGNNAKKSGDKIIVHGKLKNTNGEKIVLFQMKTYILKPIDSMKIDDNGEFRFTYKPEGTCFYMLKLGADNFITLLMDKGEEAEITGNSRQLANEYEVKGSSGSELLSELNKFTRKNYKKADSLLKIQTLNQDSPKFSQIKKAGDSLYDVLYTSQQKYVQQFIKKNPSSLASLFALYQVFGRQKVLNERDDFTYYRILDSTLVPLYPKNDFVMELHARVSDIEKYKSDLQHAASKLDSGKVAPEIILKNPGSFPQPLSSLKGRVTLLLFWAASSQPSLKVLNQFKWIQKKYAPKGFTVYAVSLDKYRQQWEDAIREYKLSWINVSDLMDWDSPVVKTYAIESIPQAILIDRDGRIIKRGITDVQLSVMLNKIYKF